MSENYRISIHVDFTGTKAEAEYVAKQTADAIGGTVTGLTAQPTRTNQGATTT